LWPDAAVREKLYALAQSLHKVCGGRIMRRDNLHLTLVFLGDVARAEIPQLEALAQRRRSAGFDLKFGVTGWWRHNRIIWAAPAATPESLRELVAALERALKFEGFKFDLRSYVPHITLVRDACAPTALPPLAFDWQVGEFALVECARGARGHEYRVLARRALER
jgi:RNA 2',3'-cyclic 3'-phosphodiesterase